MTLTITYPTQDQPLGIGMSTQVASDAGTIPSGWHLEASILGFGQRVLAFGQVRDLPTPSAEIQMGQTRSVTSGTTTWQVYPQYPDTPHGSTVTLRVALRHPVDGVVEQLDRQVKYDTLTGLQTALPNLIRATTGGYTDSDRSVATQTLTAVQTVFPSGLVGIADVVANIGQMFTQPPVELLRRDTQLILTGRGTLVYPTGNSEVAAYGAHVSLVTPPPGAGFRDGVVQEFELRVIQVAVHGRHGNTATYLKFLHDLDHVGQYLIWGAPFPRRVEYDVTPGFSVGWRWLVVGVQS